MTSVQTIHIVDDDEALSDALAGFFSGNGYRVRTYGSATAFGAAWPSVAMAGDPAVMISDVCMPGRSGLDLLRDLRSGGGAAGRRLPVVILSGHATVPLAVQAMQDGATYVLEKPADPDKLLATVVAAFDAIPEQPKLAPRGTAARERLKDLTPRERQVLRSFVNLGSNKAVAAELGMSPRTVEIHRTRIFRKSNTSTVPELVRLSLEAEIAP